MSTQGSEQKKLITGRTKTIMNTIAEKEMIKETKAVGKGSAYK